MSHLTMEQLVQMRDPVSDIGSGAARGHLESCPHCQGELDRLHQRVARLKALPALRAPRDLWPGVREQVMAARRGRRVRWMTVAGMALAASVTIAVVVTDVSHPADLSASTAALDSAKAQSRRLEEAIQDLAPQNRVLDGRTANLAAELEDRIAELDHQLQQTQLQAEPRAQPDQLLRLWRERVGLLDALVDVHVTRASNVGL